MSNDENKFQPIFQIRHIKSAWFLLELAMALVTTIGMRFLQVCTGAMGALALAILNIGYLVFTTRNFWTFYYCQHRNGNFYYNSGPAISKSLIGPCKGYNFLGG